jgi:hypothetical protein
MLNASPTEKNDFEAVFGNEHTMFASAKLFRKCVSSGLATGLTLM